VLKALEIASSDPRYAFLVYNASVVYWRTSRALQRKGCYKHLLPTMPSVAEGIRALGEEDNEWKARFLVALARVYDDCGESDNALKMLSDALAMAQDDDARTEIVRLMVHADRAKGGAAGEKAASDKMLQYHVVVQKVRSSPNLPFGIHG
jgi:hypothetical protein